MVFDDVGAVIFTGSWRWSPGREEDGDLLAKRLLTRE